MEVLGLRRQSVICWVESVLPSLTQSHFHPPTCSLPSPPAVLHHHGHHLMVGLQARCVWQRWVPQVVSGCLLVVSGRSAGPIRCVLCLPASQTRTESAHCCPLPLASQTVTRSNGYALIWRGRRLLFASSQHQNRRLLDESMQFTCCQPVLMVSCGREFSGTWHANTSDLNE